VGNRDDGTLEGPSALLQPEHGPPHPPYVLNACSVEEP